jgi:Macrocin-O-methyltransferase (TylF)
VREIRACRPGPDTESLRAAYLELLKLTLCDLAGAGTETAYLSYDKTRVFRREPSEEELRYRLVGKDWPLYGLTMVGLTRLDDLQACVEAIVNDNVEGDLIEAGTWRGGASILMRATLDTLGADERTVWLADSFQGFPRPDVDAYPDDRGLDLSPHDFLSVPVGEVQNHFARLGFDTGFTLVPGLFDRTLPALRGRHWSLVRLDGDTYESTWVALESLYPGLQVGGYVVIDDYGFVPACRKAVGDFRDEHGISEPIEEVDWNCARWRRLEPEPQTTEYAAATKLSMVEPSSRAIQHRTYDRLPTERELELEAELNSVRERLLAAESALERLGPAPR